MARTVGAMHVAKISRRHGDREYDSYLVRRSISPHRLRHFLFTWLKTQGSTTR